MRYIGFSVGLVGLLFVACSTSNNSSPPDETTLSGEDASSSPGDNGSSTGNDDSGDSGTSSSSDSGSSSRRDSGSSSGKDSGSDSGGNDAAASQDSGVTPPPPNGNLVGPVITGTATFYDADGTGNCSFPKSNASPLLVVAPNKSRWYNVGTELAGACGECLNVTGSKGFVVVEVVDSCPSGTGAMDCGVSGADLDLSQDAFSRIANLSDGKVPITFQVVPCTVAGFMQYVFKDGSNQYWSPIQIRNHREPIATVEYDSDGKGTWVNLPRSDDNYFRPITVTVDPVTKQQTIVENGLGAHNGLTLRITDAYGQVVVDTVPVTLDTHTISSSTIFPGTQQFD